jgi:hypothetical protein
MMMQSAYSLKRMVWVAGVGLAVAALAAALLGAWRPALAGDTVVARGIVKPGGDGDLINVYITHVSEAADPTVLRGSRIEVNLDQAKKYKWQVEKGVLTKVRTTSNPVPEKEVVIKGTYSEDRITASWLVQNYREFHIEGTLEARDLDLGSIDEGYITINVTKSVMRDV